ncbi:hypothetical protein NDU88_004866 [Pleurodeles waltl]|uniref:Uncharacterized protein n=1 Tax=Pleurodeles waltl TaxID=8319 RepID=A0AAV7PGZ8_PLEWA|nr:hypothetical protein NDU88_004866 [Pleurodeles waltl]
MACATREISGGRREAELLPLFKFNLVPPMHLDGDIRRDGRASFLEAAPQGAPFCLSSSQRPFGISASSSKPSVRSLYKSEVSHVSTCTSFYLPYTC